MTHATPYMADLAALRWYLDHGVYDALLDAPQDRTKVQAQDDTLLHHVQSHSAQPQSSVAPAQALLGKSDAYDEAIKIAKSANSLKELALAIHAFEGIGIKKTASNLVFGAGYEHARVMVIGDVPYADEDRQGTPFAGDHGRLMDKILASIHLDRMGQTPENGVYLTNVINWRPPGNRSPTEAEIQVSLPFIERHIQLVAPKILVLCGELAAKTLLGRSESLSRLRNSWHDYTPQTPDIANTGTNPIPSIVTYHPLLLLNTPLHKKSVWKDVIEIAEKIKNIG